MDGGSRHGDSASGPSVRPPGDTIASITSGPYEWPDADAQVLDLDGAWVLPGFWNMHTHLSIVFPDNHALDDELMPSKVIRAGLNAVDALKAGFTTLRITGERDFMDVAWKQAFDSAVFVGPRIVAGGRPISTDGDTDWLVRTGKGPEGIRAAVADNIANG